MSETSEITGPLIKMLRQAGALTFRMQSGKVKVRGGWMYLCPEGTADILCFPRIGATCWIETKQPKGIHTDEQMRFRDDVMRMGHRYILAKTIDEGLAALKG